MFKEIFDHKFSLVPWLARARFTVLLQVLSIDAGDVVALGEICVETCSALISLATVKQANRIYVRFTGAVTQESFKIAF